MNNTKDQATCTCSKNCAKRPRYYIIMIAGRDTAGQVSYNYVSSRAWYWSDVWLWRYTVSHLHTTALNMHDSNITHQYQLPSLQTSSTTTDMVYVFTWLEGLPGQKPSKEHCRCQHPNVVTCMRAKHSVGEH